MHDLVQRTRRALLVAVQLPGVGDDELADSVAELGQLARTLGHEVVGPCTQRRSAFDPAAYLGAGKIDEIRARVEAGEVDLLLVDHEISPSQARHLETASGAEVLDRTGVILEIFHRHAHTRAARLQVEIVRLQYLAPRLREKRKGQGQGRQRSGIGGRGAGETDLELDRRKIRDRIAELTLQLEAIETERRTQRARRRDLARVALVGYTNAGKSTLMRGLTQSDVLVADKLFATLDTTVRTLHPPTRPPILVSDTVGFIKKLPHGLVASFKSTLEEAAEAALLVHVVDASDRAFERQLEVTAGVLAEIGAAQVPRLLAFNKIDRVSDPAAISTALQARWPDAVVLSAREPADVARLRAAILAAFTRGLVEADLLLPYDRQELRGLVYSASEVLEERYVEEGVVLRTRAHPQVLESLRDRLRQ